MTSSWITITQKMMNREFLKYFVRSMAVITVLYPSKERIRGHMVGGHWMDSALVFKDVITIQ